LFGLARAQLTNTIFKHALSTCSAEYSGCAVPQPRRGAPDAIAFASRPELCSSLYVSDFSGSVGRFRSSGVVFEQRTEHIVVEIEPSSRFLFQCVVRVYRIGRFAKWAGASCFCVQTDYCRLAILSWFDSLSSGSSQARVFLFVWLERRLGVAPPFLRVRGAVSRSRHGYGWRYSVAALGLAWPASGTRAAYHPTFWERLSRFAYSADCLSVCRVRPCLLLGGVQSQSCPHPTNRPACLGRGSRYG